MAVNHQSLPPPAAPPLVAVAPIEPSAGDHGEVITGADLIKMSRRYCTYLHHWKRDPVAFAYECLNAHNLPYQALALESYMKHKRTIIRSGNGPGKTFLMAEAAFHWLITNYTIGAESVVMATGPAGGQLENAFWGAVSKIYNMLPVFLREKFRMTTESCYCLENPAGWHMTMRTAKKENKDSLAGSHNCLYLIDEWSGVPEEIYEVIEGSMSEQSSKILAIGNPLYNSGWGYHAFNRNRHLWKNIHINCEQWSSQYEYRTIWQGTDGTINEDWNLGLCAQEEFQKWSDIYGADSGEYRSHVLGEFPESEAGQLIKTSWVRDSLNRSAHANQSTTDPLIAGIDIAWRGNDDSAIVVRCGKNILEAEVWHSNDFNFSIARIIDFFRTREESFFQAIYIDTVGMGGPIYDALRIRKPDNIKSVLSFMSHEKSPVDSADRYRDYCWWKMRQYFQLNSPALLITDRRLQERLVKELTSVKYSYNNSGRLKVQSKREIKDGSPDVADALSMTFAVSAILEPEYLKKKNTDDYLPEQLELTGEVTWKTV